MPAKIIKAGTLADLEVKLNGAMADHYLPSGGPFLNPESRVWCQLVTSNLGHIELKTAAEIPLREPEALGKSRRK